MAAVRGCKRGETLITGPHDGSEICRLPVAESLYV